MSIEDREKHLKTIKEIKQELIEMLIELGESKETIERVINATTKAEVLDLKIELLKRASLMHHDGAHPYGGQTHDNDEMEI